MVSNKTEDKKILDWATEQRDYFRKREIQCKLAHQFYEESIWKYQDTTELDPQLKQEYEAYLIRKEIQKP